MIAAATHGPSALWYATRGAGAMTLVLLSASLVLGIGEVRLWRPIGASRFAFAAMHRTVSLLALVFLVVHIVTTLLDPFPPVGLLTAVVPFATHYRPLWMGLGTLASDLLLALVVTSLIRGRLGYRTWRALHWLAYACWPIGVAHGLGTGSDTQSTWMLALTLVCIGAVALAIASRLIAPGTPRSARVNGAAAMSVGVIALGIWLPAGPLAAGWARRAGTPASVLTAFSPRVKVRAVRARPVDPLAQPFSARLAGRIRNGVSAGGSAIVELRMALRGGPRGELRIRLGGVALADGGLQLNRSAVTLGPPGDPHRYAGRTDLLKGSRLRALVGLRGGPAIRLTLDLSLGRHSVSGQVRGTPLGTMGA